jgi:tetratricopeptide (TPR) repeat protein
MIRPGVLVSLVFCLFLLNILHAHEGLHEQIEAVTRQIHQDARNADLYLKRGELYRFHQEWTNALRDYSTALKLNPGLHAVEFCRGMLYSDQGNDVAARAHLDKFLKTNPAHVAALMARARVLVRMKHYAEAVRDYDGAIAKSPEPEPEDFIERAHAVVAQGTQHTEEALDGLDEGIRKIGPIVTLQLPAIDLELQRKNYDGALARIDTLETQAERKESWLFRKGEILKMAGRPEEAEKAFQDALAAWESLPAHIKDTKATRELETQIRSELAKQD